MKTRRALTRRSKASDSSPNLARSSQSSSQEDKLFEASNKPDNKILQTIPAALQCIQHEWTKFEAQKSKWAMDKAELNARVAFLNGERKGQARLHRDLICRIKMLEYALHEEREKYKQSRSEPGVNIQPEKQAEKPTEEKPQPDGNEEFLPKRDWRSGRNLIRQYLQEIGYTDTLVLASSDRVQTMVDEYSGSVKTCSGSASVSRDVSLRLKRSATETDLSSCAYHQNDDDTDDEREDDEKRRNCTVLNEDSDPQRITDNRDWLKVWRTNHSNQTLGDLAYLKVENLPEEMEYKAWTVAYMLRGHLDSVRSLAFHPFHPVLFSGSEDRTVRAWNLDGSHTELKSPSREIECGRTFRGHAAPVTGLVVSPNGSSLFSGALDGHIHRWQLSNASYTSDQDAAVNIPLEGHADAVWDMSVRLDRGRLQMLSCSSDRTVKHWYPEETTGSCGSFQARDNECPTSVDFVRSDTDLMVASHDTGECVLFNLEAGMPTVWFEGTPCRVNCVVSHPCLPVSITAGEDGRIRYLDNRTGRIVHTVVGHREAVSCLSIDRHGMYLLSGSHDRTVCVWDCRGKNCVQEIYTHGKKHEESVLDVAHHPARSFIASAGADGLVQVFT